MRVLVVVNPRATAMSPRERDVLAHALGSEAELEVVETENRGHAAALACRAMRSGTDVVVALGGDGTVNEVINGLLTDGVHPGIPALGLVPAGSTNVFVRALGFPNDPIEATGALLEGLRTQTFRPVSMGMADDRYFCFAAGLGFDAAIVHGVERKRRQGRRSTHVLYTRVGVSEFFHADRRHPRLHVELSDGTRYDDVYFTIVANADPWTFVGNRPLHPTPDVSFETGLAVYGRRRMGVRHQRHHHQARRDGRGTRQRAADQQRGPAPPRLPRVVLFEGAVGERSGARVRVAADVEVGGGERSGIHLTGARIQ